MSIEKNDQEPSMEEILSSIRRIIADDDEENPAEKPAPATATKKREADPAPAARAAPADEIDFRSVVDETVGDDDDDDDDVLDLTEVVEPDHHDMSDDVPAAGEPFADDLDEFELELEPEDDFMEQAAPPPPPPAKEPRPTRKAVEELMQNDDGLISSSAASRSTGALAKLTKAASGRATPPLAEGDKSIEAFLGDLLRPMLKDWLDANLEGVVERVVEQEVKKLARRAELM